MNVKVGVNSKVVVQHVTLSIYIIYLYDKKKNAISMRAAQYVQH